LPPAGPAEWILYPVSPEVDLQPAVERNALFRRTFFLRGVPQAASLQVRAFTQCRIKVNSLWLKEAESVSPNWKRVKTWDIAKQLHAAENEIAVTVTNSVGPPVLWLALTADGQSIHTDEQWEVSLEGAVTRPARLASAPMELRSGNPVAGGEQTFQSFRACLPTLSLFALLSAGFLMGVHYWHRRRAAPRPGREALSALLGVALLWLLMFCNNVRAIPFPLGFDRRAHLEYIRYVQERKALPLADEGWEMHQPPLYYVIAATALGVCGLGPTDEGAYFALRLMSLLAGVAQVALIFGCLRLLFPDRPRAQFVGLLLAAFLPAHLYLFQYVTNEALAATLGTAVVYVCLRILHAEQSSLASADPPLGRAHPSSPPDTPPGSPRISSYILLGALLGAALLTKVTALALVPIVLAVLAGRLLARRERQGRERKLRGWLLLGLTTMVFACMSGWHYARVWAHFGTPLVGSYDPASGYAWWEDPGYSTVSYYLRWGRSLVAPFFSCFDGYGDGLYSTLWGDGMWGGTAYRVTRTPWNYDLMAAGYLLALGPTVAVLIGLVAALVQLIRRPRAEWFLMIGLVFSFGAAFIYHSLRLPYYGHTKAFYGLTAMVCLCAFAAWGFDLLLRQWTWSQLLFGIALGTWAMTAYASFWVDRRSAETQTWLGERWHGAGRDAVAAQSYRSALKRDPKHVDARLGLAEIFTKHGRRGEAQGELEQALRDDPDNAEVHYKIALALQESSPAQSVKHLRAAIELAPDHLFAYRALGSLLHGLGQTDAAIDACRRQLGITPTSWTSHHDLAVFLGGKGEAEQAIEHYRAALRLKPLQPRVLNGLGWILATDEDAKSRNGLEAIWLAERACEQTLSHDPISFDTLAAAYAEAGRYADADRVLRIAIALPASSGQAQLLQDMHSRLHLYKTGRPYRERRHFPDHHSR
jgi:Tfp pilus assembly protein PilF